MSSNPADCGYPSLMSLKAPKRIETSRLVLRQPTSADAAAVFDRYAGDPVVTQYVGWPRHESVEDTRVFLAFSDDEWQMWPAGPFLIESRVDGRLLGGTGLAFESPTEAATGYVLAQDAWNAGYATEALAAVTAIAARLSLKEIYALCHPDNPASVRVLKKCGFTLEARLPRHTVFPNMGISQPQDCLRFRRALG